MSTASASERLALAARYAMDAAEAVESGSEPHDSYERTAFRREVREKLEAARELLAALERDDPGATAPYHLDGGTEVTVTVPIARVWAYRAEAESMMRCYQDWAAARELIERAVAIKSDNAHDHFTLAYIFAEQNEFTAAGEAIERAISLEPDNADFQRARNSIRRDIERRSEEMNVKPKPILWTIKRWLG